MTTLQPSILKIDQDISKFQDALSSLPKFHPDRFTWLCILARAQLRRFEISYDERDLDKSILQFTQAIFHPFHSATKGGPNLIAAFFFLTVALFYRALMSSTMPVTMKYCIEYFSYFRDLPMPLEAFGVAHNNVTTLLVYAMSRQSRQMYTGSADVMTTLNQMSVLCRELLTSDEVTERLPFATTALVRVVFDLIGRSTQPPEQLIECLREANARLPDLHQVPYALSWCLAMRFNETKSNDDYDDAMAILDKIIASHSSADDPDLRSRAQGAAKLAATFAYGRFMDYKKPDHLEEAIFRHRAYLSTLTLEDPERRNCIQYLTDLEKKRSDEFGVKITDSKARFPDPEVIGLPSISNLASLVSSSAVNLTQEDRIQHLDALKSMNHITDAAYLEEAIKYAQLILTRLSPVDQLAHITACKLGHLRYLAFTRTEDVKHLNDSITAYRDLLTMPGAQWMHFGSIQGLVLALFTRFKLLKDLKDSEEVDLLYALAVNDSYAPVPSRFEVAYNWATFTRTFGHSSATAAYESAFALMQDSLVYAPTLEIQHSRLAGMHVFHQRLPLDCVSHRIHGGQIEQAVEALDRGRGLLFSEMRGLRTSLDQLCAVNSPLAEKFANINRELETLTTTTISPGVSNNGAEGHDKMDPFGCFVTRQRELTEERERLVLHIRTLPGLDRFLMAPSFHTLRSAAVRGPVIIINHNEWRSDIIILLHDSPESPLSLIPTPDGFYSHAEALRDKLLTARMQGLDSVAYQEALSSVLRDLYDLVGRPVIKRLQELNVPEQSRIWFCPTSVFCSLPLHAMGPIPSDMGPPRYFLDLYIPSYIPSLSALMESHKPSSQSFDKPSMLLVVQPDAFIMQALEEMQAVQAICPRVTTLIGATATPPGVLERLQDHRFVHIVSHGILKSGKPFESCFKLYNGKQLTLLDIVRSQLPHAEFAFLAACHTAEMADESLSDEALHLAAAMQYCGFRSVVGTMWAMADTDGRDLAGYFYGSLFSGRREGLPYHERAAEALRDAVVKLRRKRGRGMTLERWVNYVHYGA